MNRKRNYQEIFGIKFFQKLYVLLLIISIHAALGGLAFFLANTENDPQLKSDPHHKIIFVANREYTDLLGQNFVKWKISNYQNYFVLDEILPDLTQLNNSRLELTQAQPIVLMLSMFKIKSKEQVSNMLGQVPPSTPLFWVSMPPVDSRLNLKTSNSEIDDSNNFINELCAAKENCSYIDLDKLMSDTTGNLNPALHSGDGLHLNNKGLKIIEMTLNSVIP